MDLPNKEKILKCGLKRRKNHLYFIDKDGNVGEVKMKRGGQRRKSVGEKSHRKVILESKIKKENGYLYFLDADGDIGRVKATKGSPTASQKIMLKSRKKEILEKARIRNIKENRYID